MSRSSHRLAPASVGTVTSDEADEIRKLHERRLALRDLSKCLGDSFGSDGPESLAMYEKLVADLGDTNRRFDAWWRRMERKYRWKGVRGGSWNIDFDTREVSLVMGASHREHA